MKKVLLVLFVALLAISCEKEDEGIKLSQSDVIGTWNVTKVTENGETTNAPKGAITITLKSNGSYDVSFLGLDYTGTFKIEKDTVIGITTDPITEYFKFTSLIGSKAKISYTNSTGDKYGFEAEKE